MTPGDEFISLFNKLETYLTRVTHSAPGIRWYTLIDAASNLPGVRGREDELRLYGDLRNSIVHWERHPMEAIADPHPDILESFRELVAEVTRPTTVGGKCKRPVKVFSPESSLREITEYMKEHDFSQVVVQVDGSPRLITAEDITRWVESSIDADEIILVERVTAEDLLAKALDGSSVLWGPTKTIHEAREAFGRRPKPGQARLWAILVEVRIGARKEFGIVTPWDL